MSYALVEAAFASARRHLKDARVAEQNALIFALAVYKGGEPARRARFLRAYWDKKRRLHLEEALRVRRNIHLIRAEIRKLEAAGTTPPRTAA